MEPTLTTTRGQTISYTHFLTRSPIRWISYQHANSKQKVIYITHKGANNYTLKDRGGFKNSF